MVIETGFPSVKDTDFELDVKRENEVLRSTVVSLKAELQKFVKPPLVVCDVIKVIDQNAVVKVNNGHHFFVSVVDSLQGKIKPKQRVLAEQRSFTVVDVLDTNKTFPVEAFVTVDKPSETWADVGGLSSVIEEIKEVIELPIRSPELFRNVGIKPHKGILLHGPPGCGKTLLAKAVANSTNSTFIEVIASELVEKYIGEGAKLVKDIFQLAREKAPSILFIDEIDALGSERVDSANSAEREIQRTFMQLLAEMDGFNPLGDVKIICATNRLDILDPALLRPGRLDRLVKVDVPDMGAREEILRICTRDMNLSEVFLAELAMITKDFSGADLMAICTEAGYFAIRDSRSTVCQKDFLMGISKLEGSDGESKDYLHMFG
ncbi:MAG: AAA family ATPase [archaeon]